MTGHVLRFEGDQIIECIKQTIQIPIKIFRIVQEIVLLIRLGPYGPEARNLYIL